MRVAESWLSLECSSTIITSGQINDNLVPRVSFLTAKSTSFVAFGGKKRDPGNEVELTRENSQQLSDLMRMHESFRLSKSESLNHPRLVRPGLTLRMGCGERGYQGRVLSGK